MAKDRILVVDDEVAARFGIRDFLETQGYEVDEADSCQRTLELFQTSRPDAVISDYMLPDGHALDVLPRRKDIDPTAPLIILTAFGSIDLAVRAVKEGADHFLTKPVELQALLVILQRLLEHRRTRHRQLIGRSRQAREEVDPFRGTSSAIRQLAEQAKRMLATESPILIQGETGTGKGVLAKWLHEHGPRAEEAFVDLNCAGLSRDLLETELFGHEKGAFTGATARKSGLLEVAHHGSVLLDEIGDMDPQVQPKLLKVLEEKRFRRLGDVRDRYVDIRLIAATHQDLVLLVQEKRFRSDLYFQISAIPLAVPPLRERVEDIPLLAQYLLERLATDLGRGDVRLAPDAERALQTYPWPGNIRELRNVLERALLLSGRSVLGRQDLRFDTPLALDLAADDAHLTLLELERRHIERIPRSSLYQKIKQYGILVSRV